MSNKIEVKCVKPLKINGVWYKPGSIATVSTKEVGRLTLLQAIEVVKVDSNTISKSIDEAIKNPESIIEELNSIPNVSDDVAKLLYQEGYKSIVDVYEARPEELQKIKGVGKKLAKKIIDSAEQLIDLQED